MQTLYSDNEGPQKEIKEGIKKSLERNNSGNPTYQNPWDSEIHSEREVYNYECLHLKNRAIQINKWGILMSIKTEQSKSESNRDSGIIKIMAKIIEIES